MGELALPHSRRLEEVAVALRYRVIIRFVPLKLSVLGSVKRVLIRIGSVCGWRTQDRSRNLSHGLFVDLRIRNLEGRRNL
jgi:hypothetical protein